MAKTPVTSEGLTQYDHLDPAEAVRMAWAIPGVFPPHHRLMQAEVRSSMPVLARALDRLTDPPKT